MKTLAVAVVLLVLARSSAAHLPPNSTGEALDGRPCELELSLPLRSPEVFSNESVWDPVRKDLYPLGTYWTWESSSGKEMYAGCPCRLGRPCLRKCCPLGQDFDEDRGCVPSSRGDGEFRVPVSSDDGSEAYSVLASEHFYLLFGNTCYYGHYRLRPETYEDNGYFLRSSNGSLAMPVARVASLWTDEFCVDHDAGVGVPRPFLCLPLFKRMHVAVPLIEFPVFLLITTPLACCTFIAYCFLGDARRTLDAKLRMLLLFNTFYAFLFHACVMIYSGELSEFQTLTLGIGSQFFTLAMGCWISVMLFCLSLSSWAAPENMGEKIAKRLIYYCVYSWGIPLLTTLLAAVKLKGGDLPYNEVNPGYAEARAWVGILQGALLYFFVADALLLLLNFIFLIVNIMKIYQFNKEISVLGEHAVFSKHKEALWNHKKRFLACLLLLIVYCTFRSVEAAVWMVALPEPGLHVVDLVDSLAEATICLILIVYDGIFVLLKRKLLLLCPSSAFFGVRIKEKESLPKSGEETKNGAIHKG